MVLRIIGTLHNRRGDPLLLLRLLRDLKQGHKLDSIGVAWSVPSGNSEPSWDELVEEERRIQETLRDRVRMVHESSLSWDSKSFLGRCYRSFQYEFMVSLNLKRHDPGFRIILVDDRAARDERYKEIGESSEFLSELSRLPSQDQEGVLRSRYDEARTAYHDMEAYERMILHPNLALLEISLELLKMQRREDHMMRIIKESNPDAVLVRLVHCLTGLSSSLSKVQDRPDSFPTQIASLGTVMRLSEAERTVGPLPPRD